MHVESLKALGSISFDIENGKGRESDLVGDALTEIGMFLKERNVNQSIKSKDFKRKRASYEE